MGMKGSALFEKRTSVSLKEKKIPTEIYFKDLNKDKVIKYDIDLDEGQRGKVRKVVFKGVNHFSDKVVREFFEESGTDQSRADIFDSKYYNNFVDLLKETYIANGFVSVFVDKPIISKEKGICSTRIRVA